MRFFFVVLTFFLCSTYISVSAQQSRIVGNQIQANLPDGSRVFTPEWQNPIEVRSYVRPEVKFAALACEGCGYDAEVANLPFKSILIPVEEGKKLTVTIGDVSYDTEYKAGRMFSAAMREKPSPVSGSWYPKSHVMTGEIFYKNKRPYQQIKVYPILLGASGFEVRKADKITYRLGNTANYSSQQPSVFRDYASESVLSSGNWYKIGILNSGVYKLDPGFFSSLGLNTGSIDPRNIRIFGNGGGMLPQANDKFRHDDLVENAIFVQGESDGTLSPTDYVLFYGESSHDWSYDAVSDEFEHQYNLYSDTSFYFLSVDYAGGPANRIQSISSEPSSTFTPTAARKVDFYENDLSNQIKSGRLWLGEKFDLITERTYSFYVPDAVSGNSIRLTVRTAGRSDATTSFFVRAANNTLGTMNIGSTSINNNEAIYYKNAQSTFIVNTSNLTGDSLKITLTYNKGGSIRSEGWLDWIEIDYDQRLDTRNADVFEFRLAENTGAGGIAQFSIANGSNSYKIWDISDPVSVKEHTYSVSGGKIEFAAKADSVKHFIAFKDGYRSPVSGRKISNQNLHGQQVSDYLLIVHPQFLASADTLKSFHENHYGRSVQLATPQQIYNEFSSGKQDVTAIRDYIKMFYDRSGGSQPGYVCFFGDGSYDFKNHLNSPMLRNFVPTYQSRNSNSPTNSYTSDDYFSFLDDNEGLWGEGQTNDGLPHQTHLIDVAIGRLPVETKEEASAVVNKILRYVNDPASIGSWRNKVVLVADHKEGEGSLHVSQADGYTSQIRQTNPCINIDKIYMDNYVMLNTAGGTRFPEGKDALLTALDEGSLIVNYTGHGGEFAWSNSRILELGDISAMANGVRTPAVVTATCEFGRYDDQDRRSGAELLMIKEDGGAIALFTTLRLVYASPNKELNENFYNYALVYNTQFNRWPTIGEIMADTKNETFPINAFVDINSRNFTLLGDPGLQLAYPELRAEVQRLNGEPVVIGEIDTLKSLALVEVSGRITDALGNFIPTYNGDLSATVFDKPTYFITNLSKFPFYWQKNRIFNGSASVVNGEFNFKFVVPIDISYDDGFGKIGLYFYNNETDGAGCYDELHVGGTDDGAVKDDTGPTIDLYINDNTWIDGSVTGPDPYLYSEVFDESGINTVGSGIGHEISAVLDKNEGEVLVLNDFYTAQKDNYKEGTIRFQLNDLELGEHELDIRVWDVANNASESRTTFIIADDAEMAITQLLNYPNPFTTHTEFWIGHNQAGKMMDASVRIYTVSGRLVKTIQTSFFAEGNFFKDMEWDGLDEYGDAIGRGVYVYQATLRDMESGKKVSEFERLVILR